MSQSVRAAGENFLLPNGTFFVELVIFLVVLAVIWRVVLPPVQQAMRDRHDMLQRRLDGSRQAAEKFEAAKTKYAEEMAEARAESGRIRDEARAEGQHVVDELRDRAQAEVAEVLRRGEEELAAQRDRAFQELRAAIPDLSTALAGRVIGADIGAGAAHRRTVEEFLAELDHRQAAQGGKGA
jgi:F-type H+-transporting ATPase subunit b